MSRYKPKERYVYVLPPHFLLDANQRYSIVEASAILRQSRAKTYMDIRDGKLQAIKDGRRTYVHGSSLIQRSKA